MITYLKGTIAEVERDSVILECGGIGYRIFMPLSALDRLEKKEEALTIHTYFHVREEAMQLYGFLTKNDLTAFRLLLGVNGIGPKAAMGILSHFSWEDLSLAVLSEDAVALAKAPGIGRKTAQKIILELKDKLSWQESLEEKPDAPEQAPPDPEILQEAAQALAALGYGRAEAWKAVRRVSEKEKLSVEELLRAALKQM